MGLTIKSDERGCMVFANEKEGANGKYMLYSIGVSSKNQSGEWVSGFLNVRFKKGVEVANKSKIKINNAFPVVTKSNDKSYVNFMITDFENLSEGTNSDEDWVDMSNIKEEDLPFS